jgi:hypothetical protein
MGSFDVERGDPVTRRRNLLRNAALLEGVKIDVVSIAGM